MISQMNILEVLIHHRDREKLLDDLQVLGNVHVANVSPLQEEDSPLVEERNKWKKAISLVTYHAEDGKEQKVLAAPSDEDARELLLKKEHELNKKHQAIEVLNKERNALQPWGDFDWDKVRRLEKAGIFSSFWITTKKVFEAFDFGEDVACILNTVGSRVYFVIFSKDQNLELPFESIRLPEKSLNNVKNEIEKVNKETEAITDELAQSGGYLNNLDEGMEECQYQIRVAEVANSMKAISEEKLLTIKGWFPANQTDKVKQYLDEHKYVYSITAEKEKYKIPTKLKNKKFNSNFENITNIFQLPNREEFDLTPFIAVFFPIFFGYCLGDAGYGLLVILLATFGYRSFLKKMPSIARLLGIMGLATMVLGILKSGVIFGIPIVEQTDIAFFAALSQFTFISDAQSDPFNSFNVALLIGVFQIIVGTVISIVKKMKFQGFVYGLSKVGKLFIIIGLVIVFLASQGNEFFAGIQLWGTILIYGGIAMVLLFEYPYMPILKRIGGGILPLYFIFTGFLGDTLSYIRLFALGVASSILGLVVNQIGGQIMDGAGIGMIIVGIIFLVIGHLFNFLLAFLGSFVHPLRLTFVEFYNNAEFEGGGIAYEPFVGKNHEVKT